MAVPLLTGADLNNQRLLAVASPSAGTDGVNKDYVDNLLAGLRWKQPARAATTANGTLASAFANGSVIDGVTLATGDRILVKDQTTQTENGIYTVNATGAPTRASDADSTDELHGAAVLVTSGSVNADKAYVQTTDNPTIGTSNIVFAQFGGGGSYTADGQGIELSGSTFSIELDGTTLAKSATGLRVGSGAAGAGLTEASGVLAVGQGTGITVAANDIAINTAVVAQKFSQDIGDGAATSIAVTHNLNTKDVTVQVRRKSDDVMVFADVVATSVNVVTITFSSAPAAAAYRATVIG